LFDVPVTLRLPVGTSTGLRRNGRVLHLKTRVAREVGESVASGVNMTLSLEAGSNIPAGGFDVRTSHCDVTRANLHISGDLDTDGAAVLAQVIDGHVRAGRRFLRVNLGGVRTLGDAAMVVIARAHEQLLAARGTLILTGVGDRIEAALRLAAPGSPLLLLPAMASDVDRPTA
jgi:anti-anti-sigma regulatory factor